MTPDTVTPDPVTPDPWERLAEWVPGEELERGVETTLATATPDGRPSVRMVLLKGADARGLMFFTNYESRKGRELEENPRAALVIRLPGRQVRVEGPVERVEPEVSDAYWAIRPPASRRSAAASAQSQPIGSRAELEAAVAAQPDEPTRPDTWGGYRLAPETFEFWVHHEDRLHERHFFRRDGAAWRVTLLQP